MENTNESEQLNFNTQNIMSNYGQLKDDSLQKDSAYQTMIFTEAIGLRRRNRLDECVVFDMLSIQLIVAVI